VLTLQPEDGGGSPKRWYPTSSHRVTPQTTAKWLILRTSSHEHKMAVA